MFGKKKAGTVPPPPPHEADIKENIGDVTNGSIRDMGMNLVPPDESIYQ